MTSWIFLTAAGVSPVQALMLSAGFLGFHLHLALPPTTPSIEAAVLAAASAA